MLSERDVSIENSELWAVSAASDGQSLRVNLTLVNSLSRALSDVLKDILSYIIPMVDKHQNFDLLDPCNDMSVLTEVWLAAFSNERFFQLTFSDCLTSKATMDVTIEKYCCKFPFSWEIIDQLDELCKGNTDVCFTVLFVNGVMIL